MSVATAVPLKGLWTVWTRAPAVVRYALLTVVYLVITLRMTEPAYRNLTGAVFGCCDTPQHAWSYWWTRHALLDLGRWPLATNYLFYPQELGAISLTTMVNYNALLSVPLQLVFGLNAAMNLIVLSSFVLSALGAFVLIRYEIRDVIAAFVGSLIFAFTPPLFARLSTGHYTTITIWPTPLIVLAWLIMLRQGSWRAAVATGALLGFQWSVNPYQGSYVVVLVAALALAHFWGAWQRGTLRTVSSLATLARNAVLLALSLVVVLFPHLISILADLSAGHSARVPISQANSFAPDLLAFIVPSPFHPDFKQAFAALNRQIGALDPVRVVFPGYLALMLGIAGVVRGVIFRLDRQITGPWSLSLGVLFLLSLGPLLHVHGQTQFRVSDVQFTIPLPFLLFWHIPILGEGRTTANFCFTIALCLAVLGGSTLARLLDSIRHRPLAVLLALALAVGVLYESLATPVVFGGLAVSPFYRKIAQEPGEFAVLELPLGWRDGRIGYGELRTEFLYFATVHQKPLVNGYASRVPDAHFEFYRSRPGLGFLIDPSKPASPEAQDGAVVRETRRELNVRYVLVHPGRYQQEYAEYVERVIGLNEVYRDEHLRAYELR